MGLVFPPARPTLTSPVCAPCGRIPVRPCGRNHIPQCDLFLALRPDDNADLDHAPVKRFKGMVQFLICRFRDLVLDQLGQQQAWPNDVFFPLIRRLAEILGHNRLKEFILLDVDRFAIGQDRCIDFGFRDCDVFASQACWMIFLLTSSSTLSKPLREIRYSPKSSRVIGIDP